MCVCGCGEGGSSRNVMLTLVHIPQNIAQSPIY